MENKDPFFDNFRNSAQKLESETSGDAWTKLSARLDKHERPVARRRRLPGMGILSVAASILLLVGLVFVISQTVLKPDVSEVATTQIATPKQVEDLPLLASNETISSPQMAEYQRKINANPRGLIREGGDHKRLVAQAINQKRDIEISNETSDNHPFSIQQFNWILGTWKSNTPDGTATEEWRSVSPTHFVGTGTFTQANNKSTFSEEMTIREENNRIILTAVTESVGEKIDYELLEMSGNKSIFVNKNIHFPTHVVMTRGEDGGFSIVFKNIPPITIPQDNILLQNQQNSINAKEIKRVVDRKI